MKYVVNGCKHTQKKELFAFSALVVLMFGEIMHNFSTEHK